MPAINQIMPSIELYGHVGDNTSYIQFFGSLSKLRTRSTLFIEHI